MKKENRRTLCSLLLHLLIVLLGSVALCGQIFSNTGMENGVDAHGIAAFRFFTNDGNLLCICISMLSAFFEMRSLFHQSHRKPRGFYYAELAGAVSEAIILLVVLLMLLPSMGAGLLKGYSMLVLHVINPLLAVAVFLFFGEESLSAKQKEKTPHAALLFGILPVTVYGAVAIVLCLTRVWTGNNIPYPFLRIYENPVWMSVCSAVGILGGSYLLALLFSFLNRWLTAKKS